MIKKVVLFTAFLVLAGCGGSSLLMKPSASQQITPASKGKAKIVFMRTSFVAGAINAEIFEVKKSGELKFIGSLPTGNKIIYETTPGKKNFMAYGTAADFMQANVLAGKTYYAIVRPNWGTGGFAPTPVRRDGTTEYNTSIPEFKEWVNGTTLIEAKPAEAAAWFAKEKQELQKVYTEYWSRYQRKTPNEKAQRTINPHDGM